MVRARVRVEVHRAQHLSYGIVPKEGPRSRWSPSYPSSHPNKHTTREHRKRLQPLCVAVLHLPISIITPFTILQLQFPYFHHAPAIHEHNMAPKVSPPWVKELKPSGPQGSELLQKERNASNLDVRRLSEFIHTKEEIQRKDRILEILSADKVFDKSQNYFAGRIDRFEMSLARAKRLRQLTVEHKWSAADFILANELLSESTPYRLHDSMFLVRWRIILISNYPTDCYLDYPQRTRHRRTAQTFPREGRKLRVYWLLRAD